MSRNMRSVEPKDITVKEIYSFLLGAVAPRPIALVSTISEDGVHNLAPFSFFNAMGSNPPVVCFSPSRRTGENPLKDTYNNLAATKECVVQSITGNIKQELTPRHIPAVIRQIDEVPVTLNGKKVELAVTRILN